MRDKDEYAEYLEKVLECAVNHKYKSDRVAVRVFWVAKSEHNKLAQYYMQATFKDKSFDDEKYDGPNMVHIGTVDLRLLDNIALHHGLYRNQFGFSDHGSKDTTLQILYTSEDGLDLEVHPWATDRSKEYIG